MISPKTLSTAVLLAFTSVSLAQTGEGGRSPSTQGVAPDGSRPSEGAITGGPLLPGESGGTPSGATLPNAPAKSALERCLELTGTLREECLLKEQSASGGSNAPVDPVRQPEPRITRPQNRR